jgi:rare lipoprotein A
MGMRSAMRQVEIVCALAAFAAACSTAPPETPTVSLPSGTGVYKIGEPYEQNGVWYQPHTQLDYDETGVASWYGPGFHGQRTANGEIFDESGLTAAHPTLPMPVNVRVTNLDNGRSLVLRVNDRGPFARGRIIDVSARAATLLGFYGKGTANVRVTYLARADMPGAAPAETAPEIAAAAAAPAAEVEMAALDPVAAVPATEQMPQSPPADSQPAFAVSDSQPAATVAGVAAVTHIYVQAGAFVARDNAERMKSRLSVLGNSSISSIDRNGQLLYRVRIGPFDDVGAADAALAQLSGLGSSDAKLVVDR